MACVFDANFLTLVLYPEADPPNDPSTGKAVTHAGRRIALLLEQLSKQGERIVIPTPVLAEVLVLVGTAGPEYVRLIDKSARFEMGPFDTRAAIENAAMLAEAIASGDKRSGLKATAWQKIKIDRQIVAIASSRGCRVIYSTDADIAKLAKEARIEVRHLADIDPPAETMPLFRLLEDGTIVASSPSEPEPPSERSPGAEKE